MAAMFTTHSSQWHSSQKMRIRLGSPSWAENIRDILKMRPVSEQLLHGRRVVLFLPVVVRQAGMFHLFSSFSPVQGKWFSPLGIFAPAPLTFALFLPYTTAIEIKQVLNLLCTRKEHIP